MILKPNKHFLRILILSSTKASVFPEDGSNSILNPNIMIRNYLLIDLHEEAILI